jgi:MoaA/NifB/PqqE/SkfB family radical SAM enzyme
MKKNNHSRIQHALSLRQILRNTLTMMGIFNGEYAYKGPDCVQIDLTNDCNNNCVACWCNSPLLKEKMIAPEIKKTHIDHRVLIRLIDSLAKMHTVELYFSGGGEPLMHPFVFDVLAYAKKKGFTCHLHTNFTLANEKMLEILTHIRLDSLVISLWAATPKTYVQTHPNKTEDDFVRIKRLLTLLNRRKDSFPKVKLYNVICNMNCQELIPMVELCKETGSDEVEFTVVDTIPGYTESLLFHECQITEILSSCKHIKENTRYYTNEGKLMISNFDQFERRVASDYASGAEYDREFVETIPCYVGWIFARVLADGNVNSCLKSHRIPVGNLYESDFHAIWNGVKQRSFRRCVCSGKKDPAWLALIGNDPDKKIGCYKSCDDLGRNMLMDRKMKCLTPMQTILLKSLSAILRY